MEVVLICGNILLFSENQKLQKQTNINELAHRVCSDRQLNSDSDLVCFIIQLLKYKNKLTKQTVKILMRRLIRSRLI